MTLEDLVADLPGRLLHRDGMMLVVDKPAGLPVHQGPKGGLTLDHALSYLRFGLPNDPALAHRLDKDTSGCLVLGRHRKATAELGRLFAEGKVEKTYVAVLGGELAGDAGTIDAPLAKRSPDPRSWWMEVSPAGQPAVTDWRVLGRGVGMTTVEFRPRTGRTHQLRVHAAHLGHAIVGDPVYGTRRPDGLQLHARAVMVPLGKKPVSVEAPWPAHMRRLLEACAVA